MSADLALAADPSIVERAADPAEFIVQACERAKAWLREALDHGDIEQIVECKSQAEAIRVYTMSKQLGKDAELSATEIVRRAERGIGIAIRRGQEAGEIRRRYEHEGNQHTAGRDGITKSSKPAPSDFVSQDELSGNRAGIYGMTDGVSDEDFEEAIDEARAERNLSRANVVRRIRAPRTVPWIPNAEDRSTGAAVRRRELIGQYAAENYSSRQIAELLGIQPESVRLIARDIGVDIPADKVVGNTRHLDPNRIVRETVATLEGLALGVELLDLDALSDLDTDQVGHWAASLTDSVRVLNRLIKSMRKAAQ